MSWVFFSPQNKESGPNGKTGTAAASRSMAKIKKSLANNVSYSAHTVLLWVLTLAKKGFLFFFLVYKIGLNPAPIKSCQTWSTNSQDLVLSQNRWLITFSLALLMWEKNITAKWKRKVSLPASENMQRIVTICWYRSNFKVKCSSLWMFCSYGV